MKHFHSLVFDEIIVLGTTAFTSLDWAQKLAQFDIMVLFIVVDNVQGGGGAVAVTINHSPDGRNFLPKNGGGADLTTPLLVINQTIVAQKSDLSWSTNWLAGYVQLQLVLTSSTSAHVKLYVTARDQGGR